MIKKRHFYIVIGILLAGFIVGSFLDLQINQTLYSQGNMFGVIMAAFGTYPCYAGLSFTAGGLLITSLKKKDLHIVWRIISWFLVALGYGLSVYLGSKDVSSVNGFDNKQLLLPTMAINVFIFAGFSTLGFFVCKKGDMNTLWIALMVMAVIFILALIPTSYLIKLVIHRPRYRFVVNSGEIAFHNWWESYGAYKEYVAEEHTLYGHLITKEEFKSFPSGHSGSAAIMMMVLPYLSMFFKKLKGKETMMFYIGFAWTLLMMFSRMLVGAHFLTDTCMGALIVTVVYYIGHTIATHKGLIYKEEYHSETQPVTE
ncbi:MAG: phosphatase PAP2 family protein [Bacilli bacterium]|nr:phosphatase PAP2 family protein [Bacilli bacterium]